MFTSKFKCEKCGKEWELVQGTKKDQKRELQICTVKLSVTTERDWSYSYTDGQMEIHACSQDWCQDCVNLYLKNVPKFDTQPNVQAPPPTFEAQIIALLQNLGVKFEE